MQKRLLALALSIVLPGIAHAAVKPEVRCGWYDNPVAGVATLTDKDSVWTLQTQDGYEPKGDWMPAFRDGQYVPVESGSAYGHGCVCMRLTADRTKMRVRDVKSIDIKKLATCRADKNLPPFVSRLPPPPPKPIIIPQRD